MAKKKDQTPETEDQPTAEQIAEQEAQDKEDARADEAAAKVSEDFDALIDAEDVEETPSEGDDEPQEETHEADDDVEETPSEDKGDDEQGDDDLTISSELHKRAADVGITEDEIAGFSDESDLERSVGIMESIAREQRDKEAAQEASGPAKPGKDEVGDEQKPADKAPEFENEDELDPVILKHLKAQNQKIAEFEEREKTRDAKLQDREDKDKARRENDALEQFDKRIAGLDKSFVETFGEGATNKMSARSLQHKNRMALGRHLTALGTAMVEAGTELPTSDRLFEMSLHNVFQKQVEAVQGGKLHAKTTKRSRQRIGRGSTKKTGTMTRQQSAVQVSEAFDELIDASEE